MNFEREGIRRALRLLDDRIMELCPYPVTGLDLPDAVISDYMGNLEGVEVLAGPIELAVAANFGGLENKVVLPGRIIQEDYYKVLPRVIGSNDFLLVRRELAEKVLVLGTWP